MTATIKCPECGEEYTHIENIDIHFLKRHRQ
jgi:hypothetical protein